ncbi:hypothetical protein HDV01_002247 [Terramyces sp. JEL0728]|nr:hypothetical protein HDV01_002247 [Terramyces sp. JEL0728]
MRLTEIFLSTTFRGNGRARAGIGIYFGDGDSRNVAGFLDGVTNNQAILFAAIEALKRTLQSRSVTIYCNSKYVIDGINTWVSGWKHNNWRNAKNQPIANVELWMAFDCLYSSRTGVVLQYSGDSTLIGFRKAFELAKEGSISHSIMLPVQLQNPDNTPVDTLASSTPIDASVKVYTDGSCRGNGKAGARAGIGIFVADGDPRNVSERYLDGPTNNRAEIFAIIRALEIFKDTPNVKIYSDSQYTINGIKNWIQNWKRRDWKTSNGQPVSNKDLWMKLDLLFSARNDVKIEYVEAHKGIYGNEMADKLANNGAMME